MAGIAKPGDQAPPPLDAAQLPPDAIEVGRIAEPWGVKGWFKVIPYSADPEALFSSRQWFLLPPDRGVQTFTGTLKLRVREAREHSGSVVAQARDIDDRTVAESLRGARVFIPRSGFPSAAKDEFYWVDLIGLDVVNREGVSLGRVTELLSTGLQSVLVIQYPVDDEGTKTAERMIPFVAAHVDGVDLAARRITVDWQPDY